MTGADWCWYWQKSGADSDDKWCKWRSDMHYFCPIFWKCQQVLQCVITNDFFYCGFAFANKFWLFSCARWSTLICFINCQLDLQWHHLYVSFCISRIPKCHDEDFLLKFYVVSFSWKYTLPRSNCFPSDIIFLGNTHYNKKSAEGSKWVWQRGWKWKW